MTLRSKVETGLWPGLKAGTENVETSPGNASVPVCEVYSHIQTSLRSLVAPCPDIHCCVLRGTAPGVCNGCKMQESRRTCYQRPMYVVRITKAVCLYCQLMFGAQRSSSRGRGCCKLGKHPMQWHGVLAQFTSLPSQGSVS